MALLQTILFVGWDSTREKTAATEFWTKSGYQVFFVSGEKEVLNRISLKKPTAIFFRVTSVNLVDVFEQCVKRFPNVKCIVENNSPKKWSAKQFLQLKPLEYFEKGITIEDFVRISNELNCDMNRLNGENGLDCREVLGKFVGRSSVMVALCSQILQIAKTDANVLIHGESGTGKELIAHAIHQHSRRQKHRYVTIDCAALPENLLESELFGHEMGSFTGAHKRKFGIIEYADRGTCFLMK